MLKKNHTSLEDMACQRNQEQEFLQCSKCSNFFTINSAPCKDCKCTAQEKHEAGDTVVKKLSHNHYDRKLKRNRAISSGSQLKDLASGDHDKRTKTSNDVWYLKNESVHEIPKKVAGDTNCAGDNEVAKEDTQMQTVVQYKNANFEDDKSSTCSEDVAELYELPILPENRVCPRPVICPVETCNKMLALDSVMLHFHFDHSKVIRITLSSSTSATSTCGQVYLLPSQFSANAQCLAVFILQNNNNESLNRKQDSNILLSGTMEKSLLLMGAKIRKKQLKTCDHVTSLVTIQNVYSQTEPKNISKINNNSLASGRECKSVIQDVFNDNEVLIVWLCELEDSTESYSITLLRKDKKQGYNYFGKAVHIREEQTPKQMYRRSDCLIINGTAANNILDKSNQLSVLVKVL